MNRNRLSPPPQPRPRRLARALGLAAGLATVTLTPSVPAASTPTHDPHAHHAMAKPSGNRDYQRAEVRYAVPDASLRDQQGRSVTMAEVLADRRPVMLNFIFTSCTAVCPVMTATFAQVQTQMGTERKDLRMVSISIDPEHDTPKRLAAYATRFKAEDNWTFLTGKLADIIALQRAFGVYRGDKMNHSPTAFIRTAPSAPWVRIDGFTTAKVLIEEYHRQRAHLSAQ